MEDIINGLLQSAPNFAGLLIAIYFLYKQHQDSEKRFEELTERQQIRFDEMNEKALEAHKEKTVEFMRELKDRESAFRDLEKEVREKVLNQLNENTRAMEKLLAGVAGMLK